MKFEKYQERRQQKLSDCERFKKISEKMINGECSEEEELFLKTHMGGCSACEEESAFALNIQKTLHSLPKMEVPDGFLMSLNEKLDLEDEKLMQAPRVVHVDFLRGLRKYSTLVACLLLAVLVKIDAWDITEQSDADGIISQVTETVDISEQTDNTVSQQHDEIAEEVGQGVQQMPISQNSEETVENRNNVISRNDKKRGSSKKTVSVEKPFEKKLLNLHGEQSLSQNETTEQLYKTEESDTAPIPAPPQSATVSKTEDKIIVVRPSTPHRSAELPDYMDNKDNIIFVDDSDIEVKAKKVSFEDFDVVATDKMLEAFSLAEMPSNNAIVASPAAMDSVRNISIDMNSEGSGLTVKHGAGSGTLFVSANDCPKVEDILNKYLSHAEDKVFMLSSKNYNSFINELKIEGIEYHDYMIFTDNTNVAFKLMTS